MIDFLWAITPGLFALLVKIGLALAMVYLAQSALNNKLGINVRRDILDVIKEDPRATSRYYGDRLKTNGMVVMGVFIGGLL